MVQSVQDICWRLQGRRQIAPPACFIICGNIRKGNSFPLLKFRFRRGNVGAAANHLAGKQPMQIAERPGAKAIAGYLAKTGKSQTDLCRDTGWAPGAAAGVGWPPAYLNRVLSGIVEYPGFDKIIALRAATHGEISADSFLPPLPKHDQR